MSETQVTCEHDWRAVFGSGAECRKCGATQPLWMFEKANPLAAYDEDALIEDEWEQDDEWYNDNDDWDESDYCDEWDDDSDEFEWD